MNDLEIRINPAVKNVFERYPEQVKDKMLALRDLIIETASEIDEINYLEETLKWNEPSYLTKIGSTIRIDWKSKSPDQYAIYFKCTSRLVETFQIVFNSLFDYEGKRAIVFKIDDQIPQQELKYCIKSALRYHKVKHMATLGI